MNPTHWKRRFDQILPQEPIATLATFAAMGLQEHVQAFRSEQNSTLIEQGFSFRASNFPEFVIRLQGPIRFAGAFDRDDAIHTLLHHGEIEYCRDGFKATDDGPVARTGKKRKKPKRRKKAA